jgi:hypothetical protein
VELSGYSRAFFTCGAKSYFPAYSIAGNFTRTEGHRAGEESWREWDDCILHTTRESLAILDRVREIGDTANYVI